MVGPGLLGAAAQRLFAPTILPVGVVTVSIGGAYLVWLLFREARRRRRIPAETGIGRRVVSLRPMTR